MANVYTSLRNAVVYTDKLEISTSTASLATAGVIGYDSNP